MNKGFCWMWNYQFPGPGDVPEKNKRVSLDAVKISSNKMEEASLLQAMSSCRIIPMALI